MHTSIKVSLQIAGLAVILAGISACEGGKSKSRCSSGQQWNGSSCVAENANPSNPCPIGESMQGGQCRPVSLSCEDGFHEHNGQCIANQLSVDIVTSNTCLMGGSTRVFLQYIVRDPEGQPLTVSAVDSESQALLQAEVLVNGEGLSSESRVTRDAELLNSDLALSLVLDASYSMLVEHNPPAFTPMKSAATAILSEAQDTWMANDSSFYWQLSWFDANLYSPDEVRGRNWQIEDINNIPAPEQGGATVLYKAIDRMLETHKTLYNNNVAAGERDQHIMLVFSDGADNNSGFDTASQAALEAGEANGLAWLEEGYKPVELSALKTHIANSGIPNLRVMVIGFGNKANPQNLQDIANVGNGRYFYGDNANTLEGIFREVQKEFATLQTMEIETPLPQGNYLFSLYARQTEEGLEGYTSFPVKVSTQTTPACQ